ncbi:50S ribosomal protein L11 [Patescibacteria group bacterium]|nr:50S ribosomal protein L11 [Patescibacteria group bacterium]
MAKTVIAKVKLQIPAGKATPAPPVGPALAQHGLNIAEFCQKFNDITREQEGFKIPVEITIYADRTYDFQVKQPPASQLIKKEIGLEKGSGEPNKKMVGKITKDQLRRVAERKISDLNTNDIERAMKVITGTAKNMGVEVVE